MGWLLRSHCVRCLSTLVALFYAMGAWGVGSDLGFGEPVFGTPFCQLPAM